MSNPNHDIENLFKEGFKNFEKPAGDKVWAGVKAGIKSSAATSVAATAAKSTIGIGAKVAIVAAIITVATVGTAILINYNQHPNVEENTTPKEIVTNESSPQITTAVKNETESTDVTLKSNKIAEEKTNTQLKPNIINQESKTAHRNNNKTVTKVVNESKSDKSTSQAGLNIEQKSVTETDSKSSKTEESKTASTEEKSNKTDEDNTPIESKIILSTSKGTAPFSIDFSSEFKSSHYEWKINGVLISNSKASSYTIGKAGSYELLLSITDSDGKQKVSSKTITAIEEFDLTPPNIFTPNQDGKNDIFRIDGEFEKLEVAILDQSGKLIHQWEGSYGFWDGTNPDGSYASTGIYFYIITYKIEGKTETIKKGTLTLKR